jgi:hypothetical protein
MNLSLVTKNQREGIKPYISKGIKISQSAHHKDMFIFTYPDGGFFSINSSAETILALHPPDDTKFIEKEKFEFVHTLNYKPNRVKEKWEKDKVFTSRLN